MIFKNGKIDSYIKSVKTFFNRITIPIVKQPAEIKRMKAKIITFGIIGTFIFNLLSFALKGTEIALNNNLTAIAFILLVLYFSDRILENLFNTYTDLQNDIFNQLYTSETTRIFMNITNLIRNKVIKHDENKETIMDTAEVIQTIKWYFDAVWQFWWYVPSLIADSLTLIFMTCTMLAIEIRDGNSNESIFIFSFLVICIVLYFVLGEKRIKLMKKYRKFRKTASAKEEVMYSEIKHINFISDNDFEFHANRLRNQLSENRNIAKQEHLGLNQIYIQRAIICSVFMIAILIIKVISAQSFTLDIILNVVATSSIYSSILSKISQIIRVIEDLADKVIEINTVYPEFQAINSVYAEELAKKYLEFDVESVNVTDFKVSQDPHGCFLLENSGHFSLCKGDYVLIQGPTGCGKSTLVLLLTGKLRIKNNPIKFGEDTKGYLKSIVYQTDNVLANNYALNEIVLSEQPDKFDKEKLVTILKGLCLYDILLEKANMNTDIIDTNLSDDDKVFKFLALRKTSQFSSGQTQRIALAKLLYILNDDHQIIALDEAFNRLDDYTALKCIQFVHDYIQADKKRIVLLVTHQVNLVRTICNKEVSFEEDKNDVSQITISDI